MLAVIGSPSFLPGLTPDAAGGAGGLAAGVARAAAAAGAEVQLVGKVGEDPAGDAVLISLARGGVGHLALLRDAGSATPMLRPDPTEVDPGDTEPLAALAAGGDAGDGRASERGARAARSEAGWSPEPGLPLEPADISLGLRYLRDFRVLVAADPLDEPSAAVVAEAAAFAGAALVVIARGGQATRAHRPARSCSRRQRTTRPARSPRWWGASRHPWTAAWMPPRRSGPRSSKADGSAARAEWIAAPTGRVERRRRDWPSRAGQPVGSGRWPGSGPCGPSGTTRSAPSLRALLTRRLTG